MVLGRAEGRPVVGSKSNAVPGGSDPSPPQNAFRYVSFTTPVLRCQRSVRGSSRSPVR